MSATIQEAETQLHRVTGSVLDLHPKSNPSWSRAKVALSTGQTAWVVAKFGLDVGETIDAHCTYNAKFKSYEVVTLVDNNGTVSNEVVVLRLVQELSGVGAVKANRLSDAFPDLYQTILDNPKAIADHCDADLEEVLRVREILDYENATLARVSQLLKFGYPGALAKRIARNEKAWHYALVSPYKLIPLVDGLGWLIADEVGRKNGWKVDAEDRVAAGIDHYYRNEVTRDGHTKVTGQQLLAPDALPQLLGLRPEAIAAAVDTVLIPLDTGWYTNDTHRKNATTIAEFFGAN